MNLKSTALVGLLCMGVMGSSCDDRSTPEGVLSAAGKALSEKNSAELRTTLTGNAAQLLSDDAKVQEIGQKTQGKKLGLENATVVSRAKVPGSKLRETWVYELDVVEANCNRTPLIRATVTCQARLSRCGDDGLGFGYGPGAFPPVGRAPGGSVWYRCWLTDSCLISDFRQY